MSTAFEVNLNLRLICGGSGHDIETTEVTFHLYRWIGQNSQMCEGVKERCGEIENLLFKSYFGIKL
jgi:hypothetical protein